MKTLTIAVAVAVVAWAGAAGADGAKIVISRAVWDDFQAHESKIASVGTGFYAVTEDGLGGRGYGCPEGHCKAGPSAKSEAVKACESINPGRKCIIFAEGRDIVVQYEIAP